MTRRALPASLTVALAALAVPSSAGCGDDATSPAAAPLRRVDAVRARGPRGSIDDFCDVHAEAASAPAFTWPTLAEGASPPARTPGRWQWLNLWATWCRPCVSEMPRVFEWQERLTRAGTPVNVQLLSVDASGDEVAQYAGLHPEVRGSVRMAEPGAVADYLAALGLDGGASIPVHVFVDPAGRVRCVRAGAISDDDYDDVALVVGQ